MSKVPLPEERILFTGHPAVIGSVTRLLISVFSFGIGALWFWLKSINTHYLITSQRIVIERGIFSRDIETLEIYQIDDIHLEKPLNQRLMGSGNMLLITRDLSAPKMSGSYTNRCAPVFKRLGFAFGFVMKKILENLARTNQNLKRKVVVLRATTFLFGY